VADPRFKDPDHGDFTLASDSPVVALGFSPLDPAAARRRSPPHTTLAHDGAPRRADAVAGKQHPPTVMA